MLRGTKHAACRNATGRTRLAPVASQVLAAFRTAWVAMWGSPAPHVGKPWRPGSAVLKELTAMVNGSVNRVSQGLERPPGLSKSARSTRGLLATCLTEGASLRTCRLWDRISATPAQIIDHRFRRFRRLAQSLPYNLQNISIIRWFLQEGTCSSLKSAYAVFTNVASGENNNGDQGERRDCLEPFHHNVAIARRQTEVEEN